VGIENAKGKKEEFTYFDMYKMQQEGNGKQEDTKREEKGSHTTPRAMEGRMK
jgi:hypothetical protein